MRMTVIVFLILSSLVVKAQKQLSKDEYDAVTEKYRVEYQDADKLKKRLLGLFVSIEGTDQAGIEQLKQRFGISEALMRSVAMEIYTESLVAVKEQRTDGIDGGLDAYRQQVGGALFCLGLSADQSTKQLLMSIALDNKEEMSFRQQSISSYLRASDAEETKNALLRFLVEGDRMADYARSSIYVYAKTIWDTASPEKKAAIFYALCVAASMESPQWVFEECDTRLIAMNARYKDSLQREFMLKRQLSLPFSKYYNGLRSQMEKEVNRLEKLKNHSNVSINLAALKMRNFNLPQPDLATNDLTEAMDDTGAENTTGSEAGRKVSMYVLLGIPALLLLGFGAWKLTRK